MAPFTFKTVYLLIALVVIPQVLAGPTCPNGDCVKKCKSHGGHGGHCMGHDKWGSVISSYKDKSTDPDSVHSTPCNLDNTATSDPASIPTDPSGDSPNEQPQPVTGSTPTPTEPPSTPSSSPPETSSTPKVLAAEPSPSPSDEPSTPNTSDNDAFKEAALTGHNNYRASHGASPLTWNEDLATAAKTWASRCVFEHSGGEVGKYGENLAAGSGTYTIGDAIWGWTVDEEKGYNPDTLSGLHFSQVVWKSTTELGCYANTCSPRADNKPFPASYGDWTFIVCEYNPPGNYIGQFEQNVQV